jgi:hypothetical protein
VAFSRIGGCGKAAQIPEEGNGSFERERERERERGMGWGRLGEQGQYQECTWIRVMAPNVRKMLLTKKAHEKSLTSIEQSLMAGPNCQAGSGKNGTAVFLGQAWLL